MPLDQAFALTPRNSWSVTGPGHRAYLYVYGITNYGHHLARQHFDHQHGSDELFFSGYRAGDAAVDYSAWWELQKVPYIQASYNLTDFEPYKEVALTFQFDALTESRILVYTFDGLIDEEILSVGDNQFLIEVESTDELHLFFVHARIDGTNSGGHWFFRGIDAYIA